MRHAIIFSVLFLGLSAFGQGTVRRVNTLAQLLAIDPYQVGTSTNLSYEVGGYTVSGDWGAPRTADWVSAGGLTTNAVCVFAATSGQWRFRDCKNGALDVRYAGATPNDGVDDYAAIQETVLTVAAYGGGTVRVPPGVFLLSQPLHVATTNIVDLLGSQATGGIAGNIAATVLRRMGSDTNAIIVVGTNGPTYNGPRISGMFLDGNEVANGVSVRAAANTTIDRVQIRNFAHYGVSAYGVTLRVTDSKIVCSNTNGPSGVTYGVMLGGGSGHYISHNQFYGLGIGIYCDVSGATIQANVFEPGMIAIWKPTIASDGATPFIGNFVEAHGFPVEQGTDDPAVDYDFSTLPLIGNNFAGAGSGPIRAHHGAWFTAIGNYMGPGFEVGPGVTNSVVFGNTIPWAAGTNYSNEAQNTLDLNRMHYGALLRTPRIYLGSDATFSSGPIVMDLSGTFTLDKTNAFSLYNTVLNFDDNARLFSTGVSALRTSGILGINMTPNAGLSVNYTDLGGNTFQSFIGDGNSQVAADIGGSLAFGARWQTNSTSPAALTEIVGRRANATDGSVESYMDLYVRNSANNWLKGMRISSAGNISAESGQIVLKPFTAAQIAALTGVTGGLVWNSTDVEPNIFDGTNFVSLGSGSTGPTNGTSIQIDTGSFMTTADFQDTAEVNVTRTSDVVTWSIITNSIAGTKLAAALDLSAQTSVRHPQSAAPSLTLAGMLGFDTDFTGASRGIFKFHDGTEELAIAAFEGDAAAQYEVLIGGGGSDNPSWGLLSTNSITAGFYSWLGTLGGSSYTFTNGVTNASGTVSAALAAGSNISITNNNGLLTISAVTSTNSGTVVSVDGGSAMATANFIDNTAIGFVQTGNDVTATIVDSSISTNKIDSTFYGLLMSGGSGTSVEVDGGGALASADFIDSSEIGFSESGGSVTAAIVSGSLTTNAVDAAFVNLLFSTYLPLSAGSTKPLTGGLYVRDSSGSSLNLARSGDAEPRLSFLAPLLMLGGGTTEPDTALAFGAADRSLSLAVLSSPGVYDNVITARSNLIVALQPFSVIDEVFGAGWDGSKDVPTKNAIWDQLAIVSGTSVTNHNDLSGLQGGTSAEYYHLTSAQHGVTTNLAAARKRIGFWDATQFKPVTNSAAAAIPAVRGNGFHNYTFSATVDQSVVVHGIVPATGAVDLTGGIKVNMILTSSGTSTTNVYSFAVMRWTTDLDSDSYDTAVNVTNIVSATSGTPTTVTATITTIDSMTNGDPFSLLVTRLAASNTSDTAAEVTQTYSLEMTED